MPAFSYASGCRVLSEWGEDGARTDQHPSGTRAGLHGTVLPHKLLDELTLYVSPTSYSLEPRFGCSATFRSGASLNTRLLPSEEEY